MNRLYLIMLAGILAFPRQSDAQFYYYNDRYYESAVVFEVGVNGGILNALTDLGGKKGEGKNFVKDLRWQTARLSYGGYVMAMYKNAVGARVEGCFGMVTGYDSILKEVASSTYGRYERNLSFKSRISEVQLAIEVHPLFFKSYDDDDMPPAFSPYAVVGAGYFSFDPQAKLNGQWYPLQPLRLEGQGFSEYPDHKPYELNQFNVLAGLGIKYELNHMFNARLELLHRVLFTDYLDDVSTTYIDPGLFYNYLPANQAAIAQQLYSRKWELNASDVPVEGQERGDPKDNDAYFSIQLKIGMTFGRKRR
jgi:hypothetical protein